MHQNNILLYYTIMAAQLITHFQQLLESQQEEQELILQALLLLQRRQNRIHWSYPRSSHLRMLIFEHQLYTDRQFFRTFRMNARDTYYIHISIPYHNLLQMPENALKLWSLYSYSVFSDTQKPL